MAGARGSRPTAKMCGINENTGSTRRFRLMFVCTGNICRSPFAEIVTRHLLVLRLGLRAAAPFELGSAGIRAVVGAGMHPDTRSQMARHGMDPRASDGFAARQLQPAWLAEADLVLGASRRHRAAVVETDPLTSARTFTLREFARLAEQVDPRRLPPAPVDRAHALVELARRQRGRVVSARPEDDDVADPIRGGANAHRAAAESVQQAVRAVVALLEPGRM